MSSSFISAALRRLVTERAGGACEYCLIHETDTFYGCEVDHIISIKHGGATTPENLALACTFCNRNKGSDVGSIDENGEFFRLFNPRIERWADHFEVAEDGVTLLPRTQIAAVTARLLQMNSPERRLEREALRVARGSWTADRP